MLLLFSNSAVSQQDPNFTQYMYNTLTINPAYAGTRDIFSAAVLHRSQWLGFDGAPSSQTFSAHSPIKDGKMGLGLTLINDKIGITRETEINAVYSYEIEFVEDTKLSFGINAGVNFLSLDYNDLNIYDPSDPEFSNFENKTSPQVGLGAFWYNDQYYVGLSVPAILRTDRYSESSVTDATVRDRLHYYLTAGYVFDINPTLKFKPSILIRQVSGAPLLAELSSNFLINDEFTAGIAYRVNAAFSALFAFQVNEAVLVGLAYDKGISEFANYNEGSLEFFARFELFKTYKKMYSPRFF
ncbi:PorP/SprF family type IX secretion system membrane protein [Psychroflexus aurantiacus]|nr:type IX secretion system membrane protein PorP/SprF [Psychroflexus aurantiacus]